MVRKHVAAVRDAFAQLEIRMVGGSFLIIYESDFERAKEGIAMLEEGGLEEGERGDKDGSKDEGEDEDAKPSLLYLVKLMDFAHTEVVAGEGPDEGVLLG